VGGEVYRPCEWPVNLPSNPSHLQEESTVRKILNPKPIIPAALALGELSQGWNGICFQFSGPATEEQIVAAERELGVVFPLSYRTFLQQYGAGTLDCIEIFGLPSNSLWGDVVMMNHLASRAVPRHFIKFTEDIGDYSYYLDTSQIDDEGECPVVVFGPEESGRVIANSFIDFLGEA
jgi:antitoxin YobK